MRTIYHLCLTVTLLTVFMIPVSAGEIDKGSLVHEDYINENVPISYTMDWSSSLLESFVCHGSIRTTEISLSISSNGIPETPFDKRLILSVSDHLASFVSIDPAVISQVSLNQTYTIRVMINRAQEADPGIFSGKISAVLVPDKELQPDDQIYRLNPLSMRVTVSEPAGSTTLQKANNYPVRIAQADDGIFYVSDTNAGSVFIYNSDLQLTGELRGFNQPLSVGVDRRGNIWVGDDGSDSIHVFCETGAQLFRIENSGLQMPGDMAFDRENNAYVVDSLSDTIMVFDNQGNHLRNIGSSGDGPGELKFPASLCIAYRPDGDSEIAEIYIADQGHGKIQVFLLDGTYLRSFGEPTQAFSSNWEGKFSRVQSLAIIDNTTLHALDCYQNQVQIFDGIAGTFISAYGTYGTATAEMNLPLDLVITLDREAVITNSGNRRVENIYLIP